MSFTILRQLPLPILLAAGFASATSPIPLPSERRSLSLDGAWTLVFAGATWPVTVPGGIPFTFGESTWQRSFSLNIGERPSVAFIDFDGVVNQGRASLNGTDLGPLYAFTATRFEVARLLRLNGPNQLLVTLDDRLMESTVPGGLTAQYLPAVGSPAYTLPVAWANRPGIIRGVRLSYSFSALIADVRIRQNFGPTLDYVDLVVQGTAAGASSAGQLVDVRIRQGSSIVGNCSAAITLFATFQCQVRLEQPRLWSPDDPFLYDVVFELKPPSGEVRDAGHERIGIRKFEARGARFYLNNKPIFLRGITRHDLYGERGFVADEPSIRQDLLLIKSLGVNFVRCIHYPHHELVPRIADEVGLLLSGELPAWARFSERPVVRTASAMLTSLMQRDFNRASVVMYLVASVNIDHGEDYLRTLLPLAAALDSSRPVSFVFDDFGVTPDSIAGKAAYSTRVGARFYAQNTYWPASVFSSVAPSLPATIPFISTEWAGAEGSDRGPLGTGPTISFPSHHDDGSGVSEAVQAQKMIEAYQAFQPYVCSDQRPQQCLAGAVFFNYQDIEWPALPFFFPNHLPVLRNGLVYEDRVMKIWPVILFRYFMWLLPR